MGCDVGIFGMALGRRGDFSRFSFRGFHELRGYVSQLLDAYWRFSSVLLGLISKVTIGQFLAYFILLFFGH
jgi:hypothetical protein